MAPRPISSIQTLTAIYTNAAGQVVREDDYFNLTGVTYSTARYIGTQNINYYTTLYGYDVHGQTGSGQIPPVPSPGPFTMAWDG